MWIKDVALYTKSHRVYAVDILGEPGHSDTNGPKVKGNAYTEWIEDLMEALQAREAAFVGISLGAWMCLKFACANPERVTRLAILSPAGVVSRRTGFLIKTILYLLLLGPFGKKLLYRSILGKDSMNPRLAEFLQVISKNFKPRKSTPPKLKAAQLSQLYCPILLIIGSKDVLFDTDEILVKLARAVPQLEVNYRAGSGHMLTEFSREVDRFLLTEYAPD